MTKINLETIKFYPSYPVLVVMARIDGDFFATTISSSYSLRDTMVIGMSNDGRTATSLKVGQKLSLNFLGKDQGLVSDLCGIVSGRQRLAMLQKAEVQMEDVNEIPTLTDAPVTMLGTVMRIIQEGRYSAESPTLEHLFIRIDQRLVDEKLFGEDGKINWADFEVLSYTGDGDLLVYKPGNRPKKDYWLDYRKNGRASK